MAKVIQIDDFYIAVEDDEEFAIVGGVGQTESRRVTRSHTKMGGPAEKMEAAAEKVATATERVSGTIASVCRYVRDAMVEANRPDELKIKFGIELAGEAGVPYITKGSGKAVLSIEATWKNPPAPATSGTQPAALDNSRMP